MDSIIKNPAIKEDEKYNAVVLAKASHLALYDKGIIQGDCHNQNVMVNLDYTGFQHEQKGKALIIDFGRAKKVKGPESMPENYSEIFSLINSVCNEALAREHHPYKWIKIKNTLEIPDIWNVIHKRRQRFENLTEKIGRALPNLVKRDELFAKFLGKANFNSFNHLRWKNVSSAFDLETVKATKAEPVKAAKLETVKATKVEPVKATKAEPVKPTKAEPIKFAKAEPIKFAKAEHVNPVPKQPLPPVKYRGLVVPLKHPEHPFAKLHPKIIKIGEINPHQ
jgi:hypothetical protein